MSEAHHTNPDLARDAVLAVLAFCVHPVRLGGIAIKSHAGPVRDELLRFIRRWLAQQKSFLRKLPINIADERLIGGIDLAATLRLGRPILQKGLLAEVNGGVLLVPMAERADEGLIAKLAHAMDRHEVSVEREGLSQVSPTYFGLIALDESEGAEERLSGVLADRLSFHLDLSEIRLADLKEAISLFDVGSEVNEADGIAVLPEMLSVICATALSLGVDSPRASLHALNAARVFAALFGRNAVAEEDLMLAARLVLAPRATRLPQMQEPDQKENEKENSEPQNSDDQKDEPEDELENDLEDDLENQPLDPQDIEELKDVVLESTKAAIPAGLLASLLMSSSSMRSSRQGKSGAQVRGGRRGRPAGTIAGFPDGKKRLALMDTLRAAAPWQRVRASGTVARATNKDVVTKDVMARGVTAKDEAQRAKRVHIRQEDFRVRRFRQKTQTTTIFVVDASGSSALHRLSEAKGAVELLLADCYVRRDQVAVIAFRGKDAELILPPTRSLVRAKRSLSGLPGGGGTPLASALHAAYLMAQTVAARGETPVVVLLTDAKANVARDGAPGRERAQQEALAMASVMRASKIKGLLVDTSPSASELAQTLAQQMSIRYLALPHAGAAQVAYAVKSLS